MVSAGTWERIERQKLRGQERRSRHYRPGDRPDPSRPAGTDMLPQIKHIVVLMMENHSFDNYLGTLGRGEGFPLGDDGTPDAGNPDSAGATIRAYHADSTVQEDGVPCQSWSASHTQWADGKMTGFVTSTEQNAPEGNRAAAMAYWTEAILAAGTTCAQRHRDRGAVNRETPTRPPSPNDGRRPRTEVTGSDDDQGGDDMAWVNYRPASTDHSDLRRYLRTLAARPGGCSRGRRSSSRLGRHRLPRPAHDRRARAPPAREARARPERAGDHPYRARRRLPLPRPVSVNPIRSVGARLVARAAARRGRPLALVYLVVIPSLESRLIDSKTNQFRWNIQVDRPSNGIYPRTWERASSRPTPPTWSAPGSSSTTSSARSRRRSFATGLRGPDRPTDVENDPIAVRTAKSGNIERGTVNRQARAMPRSHSCFRTRKSRCCPPRFGTHSARSAWPGSGC